MDLPVLLAIIASIAIVAYLAFNALTNKKKSSEEQQPQQEVEEDDNEPEVVRGSRRTLQNRANRPRQTVEVQRDGEQPEEIGEDEEDELDPKKIGAGKKKLAKLQMKEQKKQQRQAQDEAREERRKREEKLLEESKTEEEKRKQLEREIELEEEQRRIEKEKKAEEEYNQWKGLFQVESSGTTTKDLEEREKRMGEFVEYIKKNKVVLLEDLGTEFGMRTTEVIEKLNQFDQEGKISGVIDDRGKFIYITREEMDKVADFIKRKGRVTIDDIARESNRLIDLNPPKENADK